MAEVYRTAFSSPGGESGVLVIHCSDPRYQPHFQEFLLKHLKLGRYALVAVPGGSQFLTLSEYLPKFSWTGWRWLKFLKDAASPHRVILIAHDDCLWYKDARFFHHTGPLKERQIADLARIRRELEERFPGTAVESYYARLEEGRAAFEKL